MRAVFERLARNRDAAGHAPGSIYCVVPGKPGSGASTLAVHLAVEIGGHGATKVLLVDGDPMNNSAAFLLKLKSEFHLGDALRDWKRWMAISGHDSPSPPAASTFWPLPKARPRASR